MDNHDEVTQLLTVVAKANDHGTLFANIRESAMRRLKVLEDQTAKSLADEKKAEAERVAAAEKAAKAKADAEAKKEAEAQVDTGETKAPPTSSTPVVERRL